MCLFKLVAKSIKLYFKKSSERIIKRASSSLDIFNKFENFRGRHRGTVRCMCVLSC